MSLPEDFAEFWQATVAEAEAAPLDITRSFRDEGVLASHHVETYVYRGITGEKRHGWIALPRQGSRFPAFLWVPPYGRESLLPNEYGTREGYASVSLNFHGHDAFHQEKYVPARGYFGEGALEPETFVFRRMFQDAYLAVRLMRVFPEINEDRLAACGMSQGGGISIWLGAWCRYLKAVCADMPFLGGVRETLGRSAYRYPLKELADFMDSAPLGRERVFATLGYFDTAHQAQFCHLPTQVTLGEKDPAVRPENAERIFEALPGSKRLLRYPGGHDWTPEMIANNVDWMRTHLS